MKGWRRWVALSPEELAVVVAILAIALVGLVARHLYLKSQVSEPVAPPFPAEEKMFQ